ncbi:MAG TPA: SH3 domain-containing protein [Sphingomonas sp.]|nr:SH3 domain-containing protein [Sphingomonas sp.]
MKSSDTSSTTTPTCPPSATTPRRNAFALTGRSTRLDPRRHAVRADLADVRLASQVFAPHYAEPMAMAAVRATPILAAPSVDAETLGALAPGEVFDVLEIASVLTWGQRRSDGLVGYVARDALDRRPAEEAA